MPYILPLDPENPNYRVATVLDGASYILDVRWNGRDEAWYMDLLAADETMLRAGMKLVLGVPIYYRSNIDAMPPGAFIATDRSGQQLDAGLDDMGVRVLVMYHPFAELSEMNDAGAFD